MLGQFFVVQFEEHCIYLLTQDFPLLLASKIVVQQKHSCCWHLRELQLINFSRANHFPRNRKLSSWIPNACLFCQLHCGPHFGNAMLPQLAHETGVVKVINHNNLHQMALGCACSFLAASISKDPCCDM